MVTMSRKIKSRSEKSSAASTSASSREGLESLLELMNSMIGTKEAGEILGVCQVRVQQFVKDKRLHGFQINGKGKLYFDPAEVHELAKIELAKNKMVKQRLMM